MTGPVWIAADWGTSNLRIWAIGPDAQIMEERVSDKGMGKLAPDAFETAFLELTDDLIGSGPCDVVICGMAGARQGWVEAEYTAVPCRPYTVSPTPVDARDTRLRIRILPGLCQSSPPDVMRGEETQVAGYLAGNPDFSGMICLPGTHSKWVQVSDGKILSFRTFLTGELFNLVATQSILRHSMSEGWEESDFVDGVRCGFDAPHRLTSEMFSIRAASLLSGLAGQKAKSRLSGLLMGVELHGAYDLWSKRDLVLIGEKALCHHYEQAIDAVGGQSECFDAATMTVAGLTAAYNRLEREQA